MVHEPASSKPEHVGCTDSSLRSFATTSMGTSASRDVPFVFVSASAASIARFSQIIRTFVSTAVVLYADAALMTYNYYRLLKRLVSTDITPC